MKKSLMLLILVLSIVTAFTLYSNDITRCEQQKGGVYTTDLTEHYTDGLGNHVYVGYIKNWDCVNAYTVMKYDGSVDIFVREGTDIREAYFHELCHVENGHLNDDYIDFSEEMQCQRTGKLLLMTGIDLRRVPL